MVNKLTKLGWLQKTLGPGILFASTAIGVSHLVQSTRAGANYGFGLLLFIIIANVFKYPFFEFGSRYANATENSIIHGYKKLGEWVLLSYLTITLISMFFIASAVGAVTSGFLQNLFNTSHIGILNHIILFTICGAILSLGKYNYLDSLIKVIGFTLLVSTLFAFILVLGIVVDDALGPGIVARLGLGIAGCSRPSLPGKIVSVFSPYLQFCDRGPAATTDIRQRGEPQVAGLDRVDGYLVVAARDRLGITCIGRGLGSDLFVAEG